MVSQQKLVRLVSDYYYSDSTTLLFIVYLYTACNIYTSMVFDNGEYNVTSILVLLYGISLINWLYWVDRKNWTIL